MPNKQQFEKFNIRLEFPCVSPVTIKNIKKITLDDFFCNETKYNTTYCYILTLEKGAFSFPPLFFNYINAIHYKNENKFLTEKKMITLMITFMNTFCNLLNLLRDPEATKQVTDTINMIPKIFQKYEYSQICAIYIIFSYIYLEEFLPIVSEEKYPEFLNNEASLNPKERKFCCQTALQRMFNSFLKCNITPKTFSNLLYLIQDTDFKDDVKEYADTLFSDNRIKDLFENLSKMNGFMTVCWETIKKKNNRLLKTYNVFFLKAFLNKEKEMKKKNKILNISELKTFFLQRKTKMLESYTEHVFDYLENNEQDLIRFLENKN